MILSVLLNIQMANRKVFRYIPTKVFLRTQIEQKQYLSLLLQTIRFSRLWGKNKSVLINLNQYLGSRGRNRGVKYIFIFTSFYIFITLMLLSNAYLNTTINIRCMVTMQGKQQQVRSSLSLAHMCRCRTGGFRFLVGAEKSFQG